MFNVNIYTPKILFTLIAFMLSGTNLMGQWFNGDNYFRGDGSVQLTIRGGSSFQRIDRLEPTVGYSNNGAPTDSYMTFEKFSHRSNIGFLFTYEIGGSSTFIELGFDYSFPEGLFYDSSRFPNLRYELVNDSLNISQTHHFGHQSISLTPSIGVFFTEWWYGKFGFDWMITTTPNDFYFTSSDDRYTSQQNLIYQRNTQDILREILDTRNQFGAFAGIGFRLPSDSNYNSKLRVRLEGTVTRGLTDFIKVNNVVRPGIQYYSTEVSNTTLNFLITLGFQFQMYDL